MPNSHDRDSKILARVPATMRHVIMIVGSLRDLCRYIDSEFLVYKKSEGIDIKDDTSRDIKDDTTSQNTVNIHMLATTNNKSKFSKHE